MNVLFKSVLSILALMLSILIVKLISRIFSSNFFTLEGLNFWIALLIIFAILVTVINWMFDNK